MEILEEGTTDNASCKKYVPCKWFFPISSPF
jgi:hypothetical protein